MADPLLRFAPFRHSTHVYSVGELSVHVAAVLDADPVLQDVWLRGEVVNVSRSPAGHFYFTLKDDRAQLRCVLFRGSAFNSPVMPANGLALVAHGVVHLYERQGSCELVADLLFPEGIGLAQMQGERVYRQLEAEGLFEPSRKRPLPRLPRRIGIVSSERGAVIHDLLSVLARRFPLAEVIFVPAPVQGSGAAAAIARAVARLGHWDRDGFGVDVIVLARGGGSDDDLAAFNDERLARAIFASPVPVVSAVGHETNLTLSDLVADLRAATPSAAAELLAPDVAALTEELRALSQRAERVLRARFDLHRQTLRDSHARMARQTTYRLRTAREQLEARAARLRALSPAATLSRGYAIVESGGHVLHDASSIQPGGTLHIQLHRGRLTSTVDAVEPKP
ncbi:MAG: exodeoxyribonuclease VII large subunit [Chloroflexota bacterium]|nr:exodeoxyribonuclease VII large subunit [Chloroflexota bacterium]